MDDEVHLINEAILIEIIDRVGIGGDIIHLIPSGSDLATITVRGLAVIRVILDHAVLHVNKRQRKLGWSWEPVITIDLADPNCIEVVVDEINMVIKTSEDSLR